jgi:hypothetical protein
MLSRVRVGWEGGLRALKVKMGWWLASREDAVAYEP